MSELNQIKKLLGAVSSKGIGGLSNTDASEAFAPYMKQAIEAVNQKISSGDLVNEEAIAQVFSQDELEALSRRQPVDRGQAVSPLVNQAALDTTRLESPPFQIMIDRAVEALENISQMEYRVNDLTEQYIEGKVSIDEVSIEANKLNLAISFATTVISSASQTFKELTQIAV
jgi:flagellar hook-basal body complex protein FliE